MERSHDLIAGRICGISSGWHPDVFEDYKTMDDLYRSMYGYMGSHQAGSGTPDGPPARLKSAEVVIKFLKEVLAGPYDDDDIASIWHRSKAEILIGDGAPGGGKKMIAEALASVEKAYALDKAGKSWKD